MKIIENNCCFLPNGQASLSHCESMKLIRTKRTLMKTIDRDACKLIRERINAELQKLAVELDLNICATNARFTPTNATFKLEISTRGENGVVVTKEAQAYKTLHPLYGLPADGLGKQVRFGGKDFVITGLNPRCEKYPLTATSNGCGYKLPLSALGGRTDFGAVIS